MVRYAAANAPYWTTINILENQPRSNLTSAYDFNQKYWLFDPTCHPVPEAVYLESPSASRVEKDEIALALDWATSSSLQQR